MKSNILILAGSIATMVAANDMNTGGLSGVNKTYTAYSIGQGSYDVGLTIRGDYGNEALHVRNAVGPNTLTDVFLYGHDLFIAWGLTNWMDLSLDMPLYVDQIDGFDKLTTGFGDFATSIKIMHPGMKTDALIRLAYIFRISFPTGDPERGYYARDPQYSHVSSINTEGAFTSRGYSLNPMLAWTFDFTRIKAPQPYLLHVNFGMDALIYTPKDVNIPQENTAMVGGLAVEWLAKPTWSLFTDFYGKSRIMNVMSGPFQDIFARDQLNIAFGTKNVFQSGISSSFSVNAGLSTQENFTEWVTNHEGTGVKNYGIQPTPNVGATLTLSFGQIGKNADSDFDNNPNSTDKCPQDAEDYDGYQDEDGCPDPIHVVMAPTIIKDTVRVFQRDTVTVVHNDTVRMVIADTLQYHANQDPNAIFGFGKTTFPAITFKIGSNVLNRSSFKTLNDIAQSMKNFPDVNIKVLGYTDNTGSDATNTSLATKRADAVVAYLVGQGIPATRLQALGMGSVNPVSSNQTAEGRLLNRRVEFQRLK
jgi:outer membrane protein OmpA-like peptidoglycan-associated protein